MKLIERYLYAVKKCLPEDLREDVGKELRANIEDMLHDDYTDEDVYQVLMTLGSPSKLADEYNSKKRYLIGPGLYDKYILMLKRVISIFISVTLGITLLDWILESPSYWYQGENIIKLIVDLIVAVITGAAQGAFWVTFSFIILERTGVEDGYIDLFNKREWTPDDLPELPDNSTKISRGENLFTLIMTILVTALLYFSPQLIALYLTIENGSINVIPLFNIERLQIYIPIILVFALVQLGLVIWKFIAERCNITMAILNAAYSVAICILMIFMLNDKSLFNADLIQFLTNITTSSTTVSRWLEISKGIFSLIFIGIYGWDSTIILIRCIRKSRS